MDNLDANRFIPSGAAPSVWIEEGKLPLVTQRKDIR